MEIIIAVIIAISGWIANHMLTLRAQKKSFYNNLQNEARISITSSLRSYLDWIDEIYQSFNMMSSRWSLIDEQMKTRIETIKYSENFRTISDKQGLRLLCCDFLEEYEPLFPQTVEARNHLWKNHTLIQSNLKKISMAFNTQLPDVDGINEVMDLKIGYQLAAQKWFVRDLIVCIQNIALSRITNRTISEKTYSLEIKHIRLTTNEKLDIVFINK